MKCTLTGETSNAQKNETFQIQEAVQENSEPYAQAQHGKTRAARRHRPLRTYWFQDDWIDLQELIRDGLIKP